MISGFPDGRQARTAGRSFGTPSLFVVGLAVIAVEAQRHQPDSERGREHDAEDERDQPVAAHAQVPEAGQRPEDKESKADEDAARSEEHTSELQSLMRISYAVF